MNNKFVIFVSRTHSMVGNQHLLLSNCFKNLALLKMRVQR